MRTTSLIVIARTLKLLPINNVEYLDAKDILRIHSMAVDETGGSHGVRDMHTVLSLGNSPKQAVFGEELYPTVFLKASVYAREIIMGHPFLDGNKRTAMVCASVFLEANNYFSNLKKGQIEKFALKIVKERLELNDIAKWFEKHFNN